MTDPKPYSAREVTDGKWAVFKHGEQYTKSGGEIAAIAWAKFMNKSDPHD